MKEFEANQLLDKNYTLADAKYIARICNTAINAHLAAERKHGVKLKFVKVKAIEHPAGIGLSFQAVTRK